MKTHLDIVHSGTMGTDNTTRMTFDPNAIAHLMSVLTDLYSDPVMAAIREYSTNAWDSHVAAGVTRPIEITLPNKLQPVFVVKDYGLGMSLDTIVNQYSKYGFSSKRESDDYNGQLGLGCKSALSLTSQFTIVSVFNGLKVRVLVTREADGCGSIKVVDTAATTEVNGVEIRIPGSEAQFTTKVSEFFQYWERGTVLVNGCEPFCIWDADGPHLRLDDDVMIMTSNDLQTNKSKIVMGNVAYPINSTEFAHRDVIARVPIGSVNFAPSREALTYTKRTKETLATLSEFINGGLRIKLQEDINNCTSMRQAFEKTHRYNVIFGRYGFTAWTTTPARSDYVTVVRPDGKTVQEWRVVERARTRSHVQWRGADIPKAVEIVPKRTFALPMDPISWNANDHASRYDSSEMDCSSLASFVGLVIGHGAQHISQPIKDKTRDIFAQKGVQRAERKKVLFVQRVMTPDMLDFFEPDKIITIDEVKDHKIGNAPEPPKVKKHWFSWLANNRQNGYLLLPEVNDDLAKQKPIAWIDSTASPETRLAIVRYLGAFEVASLSPGKIEKFKKEFPDVPHVTTYVEGCVKLDVEGITPWNRYFMIEKDCAIASYDASLTEKNHHGNDLTRMFTEKMDPRKVHDPELRELFIGWRKCYRSNSRSLEEAQFVCARLSIEFPTIQPSGLIPRLRVIQKRYPLLVLLRQYVDARYGYEQLGDTVQPIYDYLNQQYAIATTEILTHPFTY
jgi:hypothetical protein